MLEDSAVAAVVDLVNRWPSRLPPRLADANEGGTSREGATGQDFPV